MKNLVFAEPAAEDLDKIIDYIAEDNPQAALRVYQTIIDATDKLRTFPGLGHAGRVGGTYELSIGSLPYIVIYNVQADTVTIVAVFHAARDLPRALADRRIQ